VFEGFKGCCRFDNRVTAGERVGPILVYWVDTVAQIWSCPCQQLTIPVSERGHTGDAVADRRRRAVDRNLFTPVEGSGDV